MTSSSPHFFVVTALGSFGPIVLRTSPSRYAGGGIETGNFRPAPRTVADTGKGSCTLLVMENPATTAPSTVDHEVGTGDAVNHDAVTSDAVSGVQGSATIEAELLIEEISIDGMCGVY